ncbi:MAG: arsenite methyltransferase [Kineosporiaceae bacterium]
MSIDDIRTAVRDRYAQAALAVTIADGPDGASCCGPTCCGGEAASETGAVAADPRDPITRDIYQGDFADDAAQTSATALAASLGCGNPLALAELSPGETVLDLGSGGGLDVLLSARRVAPTGHAYGLDMTPEMLALARRNQAEAGVTNAEFLQGTIEDIPLRDNLVDVVISNCVINLSGDKDAVLREAYRVIKPGGRFAVADIVLLRDLPEAASSIMALWTGCVSGALRDTDYVARLEAAGFTEAAVQVTRSYGREDLLELAESLPAQAIPDGIDVDGLIEAMDGAVASAFIRARKPA